MNIQEIANRAGVAKSTVSRYLNGGSVSEKTRLKIDRIVQDTGYAPNPFAQSLKAKRSQIIGIIVPRLNSYASTETLVGIEVYLLERKTRAMIVHTNLDMAREIEAIYDFSKTKVDGIILFATQFTENHLKAIQTINVPVILVGQSYAGIHSIVQNDYEAGYTIGRYFGEKNFNRIAYLGVDITDKAVGVHRKNGVIDGLKEYNQSPEIFTTSFKLDDARMLSETFINEFDAVICATDNIALGTLKAALNLKLNVPKDVSISGFGGYETTSIVTPMLTTIQFPYKETGQRAAQSLMNILDDIEVPIIQQMDYQLDEKESVDIFDRRK